MVFCLQQEMNLPKSSQRFANWMLNQGYGHFTLKLLWLISYSPLSTNEMGVHESGWCNFPKPSRGALHHLNRSKQMIPTPKSMALPINLLVLLLYDGWPLPVVDCFVMAPLKMSQIPVNKKKTEQKLKKKNMSNVNKNHHNVQCPPHMILFWMSINKKTTTFRQTALSTTRSTAPHGFELGLKPEISYDIILMQRQTHHESSSWWFYSFHAFHVCSSRSTLTSWGSR